MRDQQLRVRSRSLRPYSVERGRVRGLSVDYRLYLLSPAGRIMHALAFTSASDPDAIDAADRMRGVDPAELWQLARLVHAFPPHV